jgi:hypothetical protein
MEFMNFEKLEIYANEATEARSRNQNELAEKLENEVLRLIAEKELTFPVEEEVLINKNIASFIYKNGKTYPNLIEFIARILHIEIPIEINQCKFGPGEIVVSATDAKQAHQRLENCSHELQALIQARKERIM